MAFAIDFTTTLSKDQFDEVWRELRAQSADHPAGRVAHVAFEQDSVMRVIDVWESMEQFESFGATLMPILETVGGEATPEIFEVHYFQAG